MSKDVYELIALMARYAFTALMVLIVARAWRNTVIDSRRARTLRRISPETGLSGELVVLEGGEKAREGMKYPVIREGLLGRSREADIRLRHSSVRRRHAYFQLTPEGLSLRAHAGAQLYDRRGRPMRELLLKDGSVFTAGRVRLMLVLSGDAQRAARTSSRADDPAKSDDDWFETDPDRLFETQPVLNRRRRREGDEESW